PSQILGQIKADGQVLLINPNGIIFGGTSQIDVHTMIASTLDLPSTISANNYQLYLQNGLYFGDPTTLAGLTVVKGTSPQGAAIFGNSGGSGNGTVVVQPGAVIDTSSSLTSAADGGYVALLGAGGVTNAGTIITRNGQIILAAGGQIGLVEPPSGTVGTLTA